MTNENNVEIGFHHAQTGEIVMLNKKERILVRNVLGRVLGSESGKEYIRKNLGGEYITVAFDVLKNIGRDKT